MSRGFSDRPDRLEQCNGRTWTLTLPARSLLGLGTVGSYPTTRTTRTRSRSTTLLYIQR
jgi:hypothetical protein